MTETATLLSRNRILLLIGFGFMVFAVYVYYFVGIANIVRVMKQTDLTYYSLAFFALLASISFYALTWQSLLRNLGVEMRIHKVLLLTWVGSFFDSLAPEPGTGLTGDFSKAYLMAKTCNQDAGRIAASVVGQKILVMTITICDLILGAVLLALNYVLPVVILAFVFFILIISTFSLAGFIYFSTKPTATRRILGLVIRFISSIRKGRWNPSDFRVKTEKLLDRFHEGIQILRSNPRSLVRPSLFSFLAWSSDLLVVFLVFSSLGYAVPIDKVLIVYAMTGSLQAIGISFTGFTEIIISTSYTILGIPLSVSLAAALLTRVITFWFKLVVSYGALHLVGMEFVRGRNAANLDQTS